MVTELPAENALLIREATDADGPTIYVFLCELEDTHLDWNAFLDVYRRNLAEPVVHYLVAAQTDEVVGFVSCHVQYLLHHGGRVGEIQELFVRADRRNQQIGQRMVDALYDLARREAWVNLEVTTNRKRVDTIRFYQRERFKPTHEKLVRPVQP